MSKHLETGRQGEERAAAYLTGRGFEVVARNYRRRRAEIDLIVRRAQLLVFVEVKTRRSAAYGLPEAAVTRAKAARVIGAAEHYIRENNWLHEIRFDIVSVLFVNGAAEIEHLEDAFY